MQLRPILSSLRHHKLTAGLLIVQVALTCAIVSNAGFMIAQRAGQMLLSTGLVEHELSLVRSTNIDPHANLHAARATDLAALRAIPGVTSVVAVDDLPLSGLVDQYDACADHEAMERAMAARGMVSGCLQFYEYSGSPGEIETLGLQLVAGRDFLAQEYTDADRVQVGIVSQSLADALYPEGHALGRTVYVPGGTIRIVGIVDTLLAPRLREPTTWQYTMLWPQWPHRASVTYALRSASSDRARILKQAVATLTRVNPQRLIKADAVQTFEQMRHKYFRRDITMVGLLLAATLGLLFVTALGIAGLASFWVQQRTRSIGIRRAIGATRGDILRYFQTENFLIVTGGVVLGVILATGLNLLLMQHYELPRLPLWYLPVGAVILWLLGQLAVLSPALRAARVPPVVATRSV